MHARYVPCLIALALLAALALASSVVAERPVTIHLRTHIATAPAYLYFRVEVPTHPDNRWLHVEASADRFYRSSGVTLHGPHAPVSHWIEWADLPAGEYLVRAELRGASGWRGADETTLTVVGPDWP